MRHRTPLASGVGRYVLHGCDIFVPLAAGACAAGTLIPDVSINVPLALRMLASGTFFLIVPLALHPYQSARQLLIHPLDRP